MTPPTEPPVRLPRDDGDLEIVILWDLELLSESDYADLVVALGNIVRAADGGGIERIAFRGFLVDPDTPPDR